MLSKHGKNKQNKNHEQQQASHKPGETQKIEKVILHVELEQ